MPSWTQISILGIWVVLTVILVNLGGKNRNNYKQLIIVGYLLAVLGCAIAGLLQEFSAQVNSAFTSALSNFALIISAAIGANYISHAKLNLDPDKTWWL